MPPAENMWSLNHWIAGEVAKVIFKRETVGRLMLPDVRTYCESSVNWTLWCRREGCTWKPAGSAGV